MASHRGPRRSTEKVVVSGLSVRTCGLLLVLMFASSNIDGVRHERVVHETGLLPETTLGSHSDADLFAKGASTETRRLDRWIPVEWPLKRASTGTYAMMSEGTTGWDLRRPRRLSVVELLSGLSIMMSKQQIAWRVADLVEVASDVEVGSEGQQRVIVYPSFIARLFGVTVRSGAIVLQFRRVSVGKRHCSSEPGPTTRAESHNVQESECDQKPLELEAVPAANVECPEKMSTFLTLVESLIAQLDGTDDLLIHAESLPGGPLFVAANAWLRSVALRCDQCGRGFSLVLAGRIRTGEPAPHQRAGGVKADPGGLAAALAEWRALLEATPPVAARAGHGDQLACHALRQLILNNKQQPDIKRQMDKSAYKFLRLHFGRRVVVDIGGFRDSLYRNSDHIVIQQGRLSTLFGEDGAWANFNLAGNIVRFVLEPNTSTITFLFQGPAGYKYGPATGMFLHIFLASLTPAQLRALECAPLFGHCLLPFAANEKKRQFMIPWPVLLTSAYLNLLFVTVLVLCCHCCCCPRSGTTPAACPVWRRPRSNSEDPGQPATLDNLST